MSDTQAFISIKAVSKHFGSIRAVDRVDMAIGGGEFFSLLGPSGCGKTTLLRMLAGFETPTDGEIFIDGVSMADVAPHHRPTNMVFQSYAIFPHLDVRRNIAYGLRAQRLSRGESDRLVDEMLDVVKLPGFGARRSNELSGGQRQRVALARALIKRPKVLLLDEPLGALDKKLREEMQLELRALQQSLGITFIFVTHDQEEAMTLSDRIAVMSNGKVLQIDTPETLYERPKSREVGAFIGTMNFIGGRIQAVEPEWVVVDAGALGTFRVAGPAQGKAVGDAVLVGIRPEKLAVSDRRPAPGANGIRGRLAGTTYFGDRSHFFVEVDGLDQRISVASQNDLPPKLAANQLDSGADIWLTWAPAGAIILADSPGSCRRRNRD
jgi:spermidine/putrescine transport system ATP-binding protein/putrescine transport system ATP-binding protein